MPSEVENTPFISETTFDNGNGIQLPGSAGQPSTGHEGQFVEEYFRSPVLPTTAVPVRPGQLIPDHVVTVDTSFHEPNYHEPKGDFEGPYPHGFGPQINDTGLLEVASQTTISWRPLLETTEYVISCHPVDHEESPLEVRLQYSM